MKIFASQTVVVGSSVSYNQHTIADEYIGPSSYTTGGFVIDLAVTFSSLNSLDLVVKKGSRSANLPAVCYLISLNSPSAGKATVKIMRKRYDRTSSVGNVSNEPVGVTVQAASGATSTSESTHTHSIDHDHGSFSSGVNTFGGGSVLLNALAPLLEQHTHTLDIPNFTSTSGAGTSHNHTDNSLYQHGHSITQVATNFTAVELANGTDLSGNTWYLAATGVKA